MCGDIHIELGQESHPSRRQGHVLGHDGGDSCESWLLVPGALPGENYPAAEVSVQVLTPVLVARSCVL